MRIRSSIFALLTFGAMVTQNALAVELPAPLVDPAWLNAHRGEVTILQVSGPLAAYTAMPMIKTVGGKVVVVRVAGHIPGAHFVDFGKVRVTRNVDGKRVKGLIPLKADFEKLARSWGVNKDSAIVIVPAGMSTGDVDAATRLYWQFKYYGQQNMAILDGGMAGWLAAGYPAATDAPQARRGDWVAAGENQGILATYSDVKQVVAQKNMQLADARPQDQYMGVVTKSGELSGHLPGARDFSPDLVTTASDGSARFLTAASYKSMMTAKGLNPDAATITYCNTGHLASGLWFVSHEIVGNKMTKLYDGSMVEYSLLGGETVNPAGQN